MPDQPAAPAAAPTPAPAPDQSLATGQPPTPPAQDPQSTLMGQGTQPAAADPAAPAPTPAPEPAKPVVPEKYEFKIPDGLPPSHVEQVTAFAKARGLSQEQAQGLLDREMELQKTFAKVAEENRRALAQAWVQDVKNDPEIGNLQFDKTVELTNRVVNRYGSPELKNILNQTGLGNHPELIRFVSRIAQGMTNDQLVMPGTSPQEKPRDLAELLYPKR